MHFVTGIINVMYLSTAYGTARNQCICVENNLHTLTKQETRTGVTHFPQLTINMHEDARYRSRVSSARASDKSCMRKQIDSRTHTHTHMSGTTVHRTVHTHTSSRSCDLNT